MQHFHIYTMNNWPISDSCEWTNHSRTFVLVIVQRSHRLLHTVVYTCLGLFKFCLSLNKDFQISTLLAEKSNIAYLRNRQLRYLETSNQVLQLSVTELKLDQSELREMNLNMKAENVKLNETNQRLQEENAKLTVNCASQQNLDDLTSVHSRYLSHLKFK